MYEQKPRHLVSRKLHACIHYINDLRKMALNVVETELSRFEIFQVGLIIWLLPHQSSVFAAQYTSMVACLARSNLSSSRDVWLLAGHCDNFNMPMESVIPSRGRLN
jgi:hypothetical protein